MADKYRFHYELVQYKWPRWLHAQTEKQRTIWGYKILFLDVLFPLVVDKVLFVDADQVSAWRPRQPSQEALGFLFLFELSYFSSHEKYVCISHYSEIWKSSTEM